MMGYGYRYGMMGGGWILWLIPVILIGIIVYAAIRLGSGKRTESSSIYYASNNRSLDILKERFAKGEIDENEYERMKEVLKK